MGGRTSVDLGHIDQDIQQLIFSEKDTRNMSQSAVETVPQPVEGIKVKALSAQVKELQPEEAEPLEVEPIEPSNGVNGANGPNGHAIPEQSHDALPQRLDGHKEPLKLSGVLDQFKHFDVTPVIGREFVGIDLVRWLRAPNSDELLRDLAITSTSSIARGAALSSVYTC